eukprot:COSAG05_NODE_2463_length_3031_cov_2.166439_2_plen_53_part_00
MYSAAASQRRFFSSALVQCQNSGLLTALGRCPIVAFGGIEAVRLLLYQLPWR